MTKDYLGGRIKDDSKFVFNLWFSLQGTQGKFGFDGWLRDELGFVLWPLKLDGGPGHTLQNTINIWKSAKLNGGTSHTLKYTLNIWKSAMLERGLGHTPKTRGTSFKWDTIAKCGQMSE